MAAELPTWGYKEFYAARNSDAPLDAVFRLAREYMKTVTCHVGDDGKVPISKDIHGLSAAAACIGAFIVDHRNGPHYYWKNDDSKLEVLAGCVEELRQIHMATLYL